MPLTKIRWEPCGSMLIGYAGSVEPSWLVQGPERGTYRLYEFKLGVPIGIEDFDDIEKAILRAEEMEGSRC